MTQLQYQAGKIISEMYVRMRAQKRAARRRREPRRVKIGGSWRFVGKIVNGGTESGLGSANNVVVSGGEDIEGPGGFSSSRAGKGGDVSCEAGIHIFAIFFSTNTTLRTTSRTINPNAIQKTL